MAILAGWSWTQLAEPFFSPNTGRPEFQISESSGGARRVRTADLLHAMQALSQLSYGPEKAGNPRQRRRKLDRLRHQFKKIIRLADMTGGAINRRLRRR